MHGHGTYTYAEGDKFFGDTYVGEYVNGEKQGKGIFTWLDGSKYVGDFLHGKKHGNGTYTRRDGSRFAGEWRNDLAWTGVEYDPKLKIIRKAKEGRFFHIKE